MDAPPVSSASMSISSVASVSSPSTTPGAPEKAVYTPWHESSSRFATEGGSNHLCAERDAVAQGIPADEKAAVLWGPVVHSHEAATHPSSTMLAGHPKSDLGVPAELHLRSLLSSPLHAPRLVTSLSSGSPPLEAPLGSGSSGASSFRPAGAASRKAPPHESK